jgi:hypothetical protein
MRDFQKSRVYAWENNIVAPGVKRNVPYAEIKHVVNAVWLTAGLLYPPAVSPMPKQARKVYATGCRTELRFPEDRATPDWIILHEIGHALAGTFDGENDAHGPDYLFLYMQLVERHLRLPMPMLMFTATKAGLTFNVAAKPMFLDEA